MEFRNAKYNQYGTIDCEVLSPEFGWVPFTATKEDIYSVSHEIYDAAKDIAAPFIAPTEIEVITEASFLVRSQRNLMLSFSDWTQLPDATINRAAWASYRQELRDITSQKDFPKNVVWPLQPK